MAEDSSAGSWVCTDLLYGLGHVPSPRCGSSSPIVAEEHHPSPMHSQACRLVFLPFLQCPVAAKRPCRWGRDVVGWVDTVGVPMLAQLHMAAFCLLDLL